MRMKRASTFRLYRSGIGSFPFSQCSLREVIKTDPLRRAARDWWVFARARGISGGNPVTPEALDLLMEVFSRGLMVKGLTFHVGSQCTNFEHYVQALQLPARIIRETETRAE
jgi:hypothetical protein